MELNQVSQVNAALHRDISHPIVQTLERKVTLESKHWLVLLFSTALQRPAIRQRVETVTMIVKLCGLGLLQKLLPTHIVRYP